MSALEHRWEVVLQSELNVKGLEKSKEGSMICTGYFLGRESLCVALTSKSGSMWIWSEDGSEEETRYQLKTRVTSVVCYKNKRNDHDYLLIASSSNVLLFDALNKKDVIYTDVSDGVFCITHHISEDGSKDVVLLGGNCCIVGLSVHHNGDECLWTAVNDHCTSIQMISSQMCAAVIGSSIQIFSIDDDCTSLVGLDEISLGSSLTCFITSHYYYDYYHQRGSSSVESHTNGVNNNNHNNQKNHYMIASLKNGHLMKYEWNDKDQQMMEQWHTQLDPNEFALGMAFFMNNNDDNKNDNHACLMIATNQDMIRLLNVNPNIHDSQKNNHVLLVKHHLSETIIAFDHCISLSESGTLNIWKCVDQSSSHLSSSYINSSITHHQKSLKSDHHKQLNQLIQLRNHLKQELKEDLVKIDDDDQSLSSSVHCTLTPMEDESSLMLSIQPSVECVMIFADQVLEPLLIPKPPSQFPLDLQSDTKSELKIQAILGSRVFTMSQSIPRFCSFLYVSQMDTDTSSSFPNSTKSMSKITLDFKPLKLSGLPERITDWVNQSFLVDLEQPSPSIRLAFVSLRNQLSLQFEYDYSSQIFEMILIQNKLIDQSDQRDDDYGDGDEHNKHGNNDHNNNNNNHTKPDLSLQTCSEMIQDLLKYLNITELNSHYENPDLMKYLHKELIPNIDELKDIHSEMSNEMALDMDELKGSIVKCDDCMLNQQWQECKLHISQVQSFNQKLLFQHHRTQSNRTSLLNSLSMLNRIIQASGDLRIGRYRTHVITQCRQAFKNRDIDLFIQTILG